jgi:hypothetical protein
MNTKWPLLIGIAAIVSLSSSAHAGQSRQNELLFQHIFSAQGQSAAPAESAAVSGSFFDTYLGTGHKIIGYSALAAGLTAAGTGIMLERDYDAGRTPSGSIKGAHSLSAAASGVLCIGAALSGLAAYWDIIDYSSVNTYNVHMGLGVLSALGFLTSIAIAPESEGNTKLKKSSYSAHCGLGIAAGVTMCATVIVIQF